MWQSFEISSLVENSSNARHCLYFLAPTRQISFENFKIKATPPNVMDYIGKLLSAYTYFLMHGRNFVLYQIMLE